MCVLVKTGALIVLPIIHTENKTKKILGTIWGRKLDSKFSKVLWCFYKLEIHKVSRFVKSHDWNLKFSSWLSQVSQIVLFKNEEKDWKERKKMKKWTWQSTSSLSLYVYGQKIILFENIVWKNLVYTITFAV